MRHAPTASDLKRWGSKTRPTTGTLSSGAVISMWHGSWTCLARRTCAHKIFERRWARRVGFFKISRSVCTRMCMYVCTHVLKGLGAACTFP